MPCRVKRIHAQITYMIQEKLSKKQKKILGALGITVVLGSWVAIPILGKIFYDIPSMDTAFLLTVFWAFIWSVNVLRKKYITG